MRYFAVAFLLSVLLFHAVIGDVEQEQTREKRSNDDSDVQDLNRARRAVPRLASHQGLINPADMRMKSLRSDPYRRAPRMKRFRRMAEDPEIFMRGPRGGKYMRRYKKTMKT